MRVRDYTLYTGALGTAFLLFKAYQVAKNPDDLRISSDIIRACDSPSTASSGYNHTAYVFYCVCKYGVSQICFQ